VKAVLNFYPLLRTKFKFLHFLKFYPLSNVPLLGDERSLLGKFQSGKYFLRFISFSLSLFSKIISELYSPPRNSNCSRERKHQPSVKVRSNLQLEEYLQALVTSMYEKTDILLDEPMG
jgi:hypothetical protein